MNCDNSIAKYVPEERESMKCVHAEPFAGVDIGLVRPTFPATVRLMS